MKEKSILSVILIHSVLRTGKNYYPRVLLEKCQYVAKEKKRCKYITDEVEISSNEENSDEENSDRENSNEGN